MICEYADCKLIPTPGQIRGVQNGLRAASEGLQSAGGVLNCHHAHRYHSTAGVVIGSAIAHEVIGASIIWQVGLLLLFSVMTPRFNNKALPNMLAFANGVACVADLWQQQQSTSDGDGGQIPFQRRLWTNGKLSTCEHSADEEAR